MIRPSCELSSRVSLVEGGWRAWGVKHRFTGPTFPCEPGFRLTSPLGPSLPCRDSFPLTEDSALAVLCGDRAFVFFPVSLWLSPAESMVHAHLLKTVFTLESRTEKLVLCCCWDKNNQMKSNLGEKGAYWAYSSRFQRSR